MLDHRAVGRCRLHTGSEIGIKIQEAPQLANLLYIVPRRSLNQIEWEATADLAGQMLLLLIKIVRERLDQWAEDWLSPAMFSCLA